MTLPHFTIVGATLVDGLGGDPVQDVAVEVRDGRIASIGPARGSASTAGTLVDAQGLTLMPGLIDCHVHISNGPDPDPILPLKELSTFSAIRAAAFARQMLLVGITAFRDAGTVGLVSVGLKHAIDTGVVPGPRIVACGQYIAMTGRDSWGRLRPEIESRMEVQVTGADEARRAAREQLRRGATAVKVAATGLISSDAGAPTDVQLTEDEMRAAFEEAHNAGYHAFAHAHSAAGCMNAIRAGADSIEHGSDLNEEIVALMVEREVFLVPTMTLDQRIAQAESDSPYPEYFIRKLESVRDMRRRSMKLALDAGVKFAMGTDSGGVPWVKHEDSAFELEAMVDAGMTPMQAIVASTSNAADLIGLRNTGRVSPSAAADLLLVDGRPDEDVGCLQDKERIRLVVKGGVLYRDGLDTGLALSSLLA